MDSAAWFGNDHPSLRRVWHPVLETRELSEGSLIPFQLLGDHYVCFLTADGPHVLPDQCPHRLAPLSQGRLVAAGSGDFQLECAYHGWCFDSAGSCVDIPALGTDATIPPAAHLRPPAEVRVAYGLVWVALDPPVTPLPAFPEWTEDSFGHVAMPHQIWSCGAAQMADNFLDVAHFPFTHTSTIGDADERMVGDYQVERDGWVFRAVHQHKAKLLDDSGRLVDRTMTFTCTAPHHVHLRLDYPDFVVVLVFFHLPMNASQTRLFCIEASTELASHPELADQQVEFQMRVGEEDRRLLETLRSKAVPLSPGIEANTKVDRITVELRRVLADLAELT